MATNTPNLNLLKKDPMTDGNETFNVQTMLNDNWDKIDAAVGEIDIPDASLTAKGKVQLSNETNSDAEDRAATPKAVSDVALQAKSYTDQQIGLVTETGTPKLVSYPLLVTATTDSQTEFEIPLDLFDSNTDTLLVSINRATLDSTHYTITNTVRDGAGQITQRAKITLLTGVKAGSKISMVVLKNVPLGPEGAINGAVLAVNSIPINRVNGLKEEVDAQLAELSQDVQEAKQSGNERKAEVVAVLIAKGISASTSESWGSLIAKMAAIIKATGNATAEDVLAGKTFSNATGNNQIGALPYLTGVRSATGTARLGDGALAVYPEKGYQKGGAGDGEIKVTPSQLQSADSNLRPPNIRQGVEIYGTVGELKPLVWDFDNFSNFNNVDPMTMAINNENEVVAMTTSTRTALGWYDKNGTKLHELTWAQMMRLPRAYYDDNAILYHGQTSPDYDFSIVNKAGTILKRLAFASSSISFGAADANYFYVYNGGNLIRFDRNLTAEWSSLPYGSFGRSKNADGTYSNVKVMNSGRVVNDKIYAVAQPNTSNGMSTGLYVFDLNTGVGKIINIDLVFLLV